MSESFVLNNGMQVIVIPNHIVPAVTHMVWYKVGAIDEPPGKSGLAHVLEHMMFKGTEKIGPGEFSKKIAQHGGNDNAFTTQDYTAYYQSIGKEFLKMVMEMEADRMRNLQFSSKDFDKELDVVLEERNMRFENVPRSILTEKMMHSLFPNHPYGIPTIGWREEIQNLTRKDALDFYDKYYSPNNAILVISGDVTAEEIKPLAEKYYGEIKSFPLIERPVIKDLPVKVNEPLITLNDEKVTEPELIIYIPAPNHNTEKSKYTYPTLLLAHMLGSGNSSILYTSLVDNQGIAAHASAYYDDIAIGPSVFNIFVIPAPGKTIQLIEKSLNNEIKKLLEDGIKEVDLERAKHELIASAIYSRDGLTPMARIFGSIAASGTDISYVANWEENINAVTVDQVNEAADFLFASQPRVTGILLPEKE